MRETKNQDALKFRALLNLYAYAVANPTNYSDSDGREPRFQDQRAMGLGPANLSSPTLIDLGQSPGGLTRDQLDCVAGKLAELLGYPFVGVSGPLVGLAKTSIMTGIGASMTAGGVVVTGPER